MASSRKKRRQQKKLAKKEQEQNAAKQLDVSKEDDDEGETNNDNVLLSLDQAERLANEESDDDDDDDDGETERTKVEPETEEETDEEAVRDNERTEETKLIDDDDDDEKMEENESAEEESDDSEDEESEEESEEEEDDDDDDEDAKGREVRANNNNNNDNDNGNDDEHCTLDLRNLLVLNGHQLDREVLYDVASTKEKTEKERCCLIPRSTPLAANEDFLLQKTSEGCQKILAGLWTLPSERTDVGQLTTLPDHFVVNLPREMPPPAAKAETRWEKFAKERGIAPKGKRSRKVWDEVSGEWRYLTGRDRKETAEDWPIMEVGGNDDPYADPWEKKRDERRAQKEKNLENRLRNRERAGALPKGTASRTVKSRAEAVARGKEGNAKDTVVTSSSSSTSSSTIPSGVPVDLRNERRRGKDLTTAALRAVQRSTASLGRFDRVREGEPERPKAARKRKFDSTAKPASASGDAERDRGRRVLERVLDGGGRRKDLAIRRGEHATGETAYDHDYDDGLGPSSYKKKKGRAGAGKMRKITKKRAAAR